MSGPWDKSDLVKWLLYSCHAVLLSCRAITGPNDAHEKEAHTITNPSSCFMWV